MTGLRVGQGFDVHALVAERPLIIGGVTIPYERGLLGHSDADVLLHAITDALLGMQRARVSYGLIRGCEMHKLHGVQSSHAEMR